LAYLLEIDLHDNNLLFLVLKAMQTKLDIPPILSRLKAETQENHNRIEKVSCMKRLFAHDYSAAEYRDCLARMYGFYAAIEPVIYRYLDDELRPNFQFRSKVKPLTQDLTQLGLSQQAISALPRCTNIPAVSTEAQSLGVWYVLEGSTLGGQVISRQLRQQFGESASQFLYFHSGYGDKNRVYWVEFCGLVEGRIDFDDNQKVQEIIRAAQLTFDCLTYWLGQAIGQSA
jgi:heme oxygenase (biliverdin-IX-beta and delta-forming)